MKRLLATLAALLVMTTLAPAPPQPETPELRPTLSVFRPAKNDEGAAEQAAVGEIVAANVTGDSRRGSFALGDASGDYEIILERGGAGRVLVEIPSEHHTS